MLMNQILYVHWKPAEASAEVKTLKQAGHSVQVFSSHGGVRVSDIHDSMPDVVVINLDRLPSHGRATAQWLRTTSSTRKIPIVFCGGQPAKVDLARQLLADAVFCNREELADAVQTALSHPQVAVPTTACSTKPLWQKLEIQAGQRLIQLSGPTHLKNFLGDALPPKVSLRRLVDPAKLQAAQADTILLFAPNSDYLKHAFPLVVKATATDRPVWIFWPKKTSALASDLTQGELLKWVRSRGWNDLKICRVDDDWAGQLFRRKRQ